MAEALHPGTFGSGIEKSEKLKMNNDNRNISHRRTARIITVASGLLFTAFSFVYLAFFQKDVLEALHYSLAQGKTVYAPWISAVVITAVLLLLRWGTAAEAARSGPS